VTLTERQYRMLRALADAPRTLHYFTNKSSFDQSSLPVERLTAYLAALVEDGYATQSGIKYVITEDGRQEVEDRQTNRATSKFYCSASVKEPLKLAQLWTTAPRPGSLNFLQHPSRGFR